MEKNLIQLCGDKVLMLLFVVLMGVPALSFAQKRQIGSLAYLNTIAGVNGIKVGTDVATISYSKLKYLDDDGKFDADSCLKFAVSDTARLKLDNDVRLNMIGVRTFKNKIVNIYLFFPKENGYKIVKEFIANYGGFFSKPDANADIYKWDSETVNLSVMYQADVEDGVAIFTSKPLVQHISQEKEAIAARKKAKEMQATKAAAAAAKNVLTYARQ
ncbi:hypothetical protein [Mucilaginibacter antarcticus]|uniref:DUF4468 domain-containing protein n=1 Tax=Mucilaginibacter antarcticus TaxID=1855725 RepID=A0ABW5XRU7_9SPHI